MSKQKNAKQKTTNKGSKSTQRGRLRKEFNDEFKAMADSYGGNDISWYTRNPELTNSAALIPFAYQPGRQVPLGEAVSASGASIASETQGVFNYDYPGIMTLTFLPSVGKSSSIDSPINVAAKEVYSKIRSKYSGSLEADAPDIMMYMIAVDSMFMFIEDLKRVYYLMGLYSPHNLYYPRQIVRALGYDWNNLYGERNMFYQKICEFVNRANRFLVPDRMDLFKRHQFMCANVYADSPDLKSQHYCFKMGGYYQLTGTDTMTTLTLRAYEDPSALKTLDDIENIFMSMYTSIAEWDTCYTINGYFERAFEGEQFIRAALPVYDGVLNPVFNSEVLLQIQNCTVVDVHPESLCVQQDPLENNILLCQPVAAPRKAGQWTELIPRCVMLSIPNSTQPTPEQQIIATRLTAVVQPGTEEGTRIIDGGTELINALEIWNSNDADEPLTGPMTTHNWLQPAVSDLNWSRGMTNVLIFLSAMAAFRFHPTMYLMWNLDYDNKEEPGFMSEHAGAVFCDTGNVTSVQPEDISNLHRVCIYSEFNCFA